MTAVPNPRTATVREALDGVDLAAVLAAHSRCAWAPAAGQYECGIAVARDGSAWSQHCAAALLAALTAVVTDLCDQAAAGALAKVAAVEALRDGLPDAEVRLLNAGMGVATLTAYVGGDLRKASTLLSPLLRHDDPEVQHVAHDLLNLLVRPARLVTRAEDYLRIHREVIRALRAALADPEGAGQ